jgi:TM2 domain-containing membrane protein YozV
MGRRMARPSTRAGGCFLTIFILAGFLLGLAIQNPMKGILIGTGIGILLALITWLIDRSRSH